MSSPYLRRGQLDAARLVGRIIRDPPIESLNPPTSGHVRVSTPTGVGAATAGSIALSANGAYFVRQTHYFEGQETIGPT